MENMNEKTKKKFRFNIVDVLIILAVVAVITLAVVLFGRFGAASENNTVKIEYVVQIPQVRSEISDKIKVGDTLIDSATKYNIGVVKSVEKVPYTVKGVDMESSKQVLAEYPEHYYVRVTVQADATDHGSYYSIGGFRISAGLRIYTRFPDFVGEGFCISLHALEQ